MSRTRLLFLIAATALFGLSVRTGASASILVIVATILLSFSILQQRVKAPVQSMGREEWGPILLLWTVIFGVLGAVGWRTSAFGPTSPLLERLPGLVWVVLAGFVFAMRHRMTRLLQVGVATTILVVTAFIGVAHLAAAEGVGIDVYFLHVGAAKALSDGHNPYTDAVEVADGSPSAEEGDTITGYVYPPVTAFAYSVGYWLFSDPRLTSLIAWLAVLGALGIASVRRCSTPGLLMVLVLAAVPGWAYVLRAAWTEPFSLALLVGGYLLWRGATRSGVVVGLALASKQYFAVVSPLFLVARGSGWLRRTVVAAATILITVGAALIWDAGSFWDSAVAFHASTPPRPDSVNVVGFLALLGRIWDPPTFLAIGVGLIVAILAGRGVTSRDRFYLVLALILASSFLVTSQAFANYWFLVFGLCSTVIWDLASGKVGQTEPDL